MKPHPLEQPALARFKLLRAKGQMARARLPALVGMAAPRAKAPALPGNRCGAGRVAQACVATNATGLDPRSVVLHERKSQIVEAYERVNAQRIVERPGAVVGPLGISEANAVSRWLRDAGAQLRS